MQGSFELSRMMYMVFPSCRLYFFRRPIDALRKVSSPECNRKSDYHSYSVDFSREYPDETSRTQREISGRPTGLWLKIDGRPLGVFHVGCGCGGGASQAMGRWSLRASFSRRAGGTNADGFFNLVHDLRFSRRHHDDFLVNLQPVSADSVEVNAHDLCKTVLLEK